MKVILISGKAGHGKDTFAQHLKENFEAHSKKVLVLHFADAVKWYARDYLGWKGEKNIEGRSLLQKIGNDTFRTIEPNYWAYITAVCARVMKDYFGFEYILIPDNRYPNEINVVKEYNENVITIRIKRYNTDGTLYDNPNLTFEQKQNEGEIALDNYAFDYIIENYNLDELRESAEELTKCEI